jgi:hypothetical protein
MDPAQALAIMCLGYDNEGSRDGRMSWNDRYSIRGHDVCALRSPRRSTLVHHQLPVMLSDNTAAWKSEQARRSRSLRNCVEIENSVVTQRLGILGGTRRAIGQRASGSSL